MRLIQFETATGERCVGVVEGDYALQVQGTGSTRELALQAIAAGRDLAAEVQAAGLSERHDYLALLAEGRVLPPLDHPDPAHCLVTGTGRFTVTRARGGRTRFTWDERLRFPWWMGGPVGGVAGGRVMKRIWKRNLRVLKALVESGRE